MIRNHEFEGGWGSRRIYLMVVLCQMIGIPMFVGLASTTVSSGSTGYLMSFSVCCLFGGIPLLYMEFVISQFTARDCIEVWKARPCLSHIGYILVFWQFLHIFYNHIMNSFTLHYLLISFENPIPYYTCGYWASESCNILTNNVTVNDDCLKLKDPPLYCEYLHTTFPEYQYWRYHIMGVKLIKEYHIAWRVCLASGLICVITFISIFRMKKSVKCVITFFTVFPICGYIMLLLGSMKQKGIVVKYDAALDSDFSDFIRNLDIPRLVLQMVYTLGLGSGVNASLACGGAFRAPCYADSVVAVVVVASVAALIVCTSAMMACPYAFEYGIDPYTILKSPLSLMYEKTPRFLFEYRHRYFFLALVYVSHSTLGIGTNVVLVLQFLEMAAARSNMVAKYPGLASFIGCIFIFLISMPLLCISGLNVLVALRRNSNVLSVFIVTIEIAVFVLWYGLDKFSEDVHFMQGLRPSNYLKISWVLSMFVLFYTFCEQAENIRVHSSTTMSDSISWYVFLVSVGLVAGVFAARLALAACRRRLRAEARLATTWGPRSELLQRSRAMFSAQAMTKEYLYRQYHLQAGIIARQNASNCRAPQQTLQFNSKVNPA